MADPEQVELLKRGVEEWNQWRRQQPPLEPTDNVMPISIDLMSADLSDTDLSDAILSNTNLSNTNLSGANLSDAILSNSILVGANLSNTDLSGSILSEAILMNAILSDADLRNANLSNTNLGYADLRNADLSNANLNNTHLHVANFGYADLHGASLNNAHFDDTTFARMDLSNVKGLDTAIHDGPSIIDINSVILPADEQTRLHFLRGVGFTETQIEYLPSLLTPRPIQYQSLFISYASQDEIIARQLHADLRKKDVPCWFAPHDLQPGNYFRERIDQAIHTQDKLLLLLSEHSVKSGWVRYEVEQAIARENQQQREVLYPIRLDDAILHSTAGWAASLKATRHIGDFTNWPDEAFYQQAFSALLRHFKVVNPPTP